MKQTRDEIHEVKVHPISLSRSRSKKPTAVHKPPTSWASRAFGSIRGGMSLVLEPPQQSWLALLGLSSIAIKRTGQAWNMLVSEGVGVQARIGRRVIDVARRVGIPGARKAKEVSTHL